MQQSPTLALVALFLWFVPLLTLPSEVRFLKKTPELPLSQKIVSALIFLAFVVMDLALLFHPYLNLLELMTLVFASLIVMLILSFVLLRGRMAVFRRLSQDRRDQRRDMVEEVRCLIDEKKREKIRAKYGDS